MAELSDDTETAIHRARGWCFDEDGEPFDDAQLHDFDVAITKLRAELEALRGAGLSPEEAADPVIAGRLLVMRTAAKPKRMVGIGRFPITPVAPDDDRLKPPPEGT